MVGQGKKSKGKVYLYYGCKASTNRLDYATTCDSPPFRAGHVDAVVWNWLRSLLEDEAQLQDGLQ